MNPRLKLEICAFFADEFRAALAAEERGDVEIVPIQGACDERPRPARAEAQPAPSDVPHLRLMCACSGGAVCPKSPHSCFEFLLGPDKVDALLNEGAHLLTPAMVRAYPETLQSMNENPESLRACFAESVRAWVVVDTGVAPLTAVEQAAFLSATGGKMELLPAELHLLRANLRAALAQWEAGAIEARSAGQIASLQHRLADYTMAYDLISRLIPHQGERTIIHGILELFYLLCAPRAAHLLLVQGDGKDGAADAAEGSAQLFSQPAGSGRESCLRIFLHCPAPWGEIEMPQKGFYFQIHQGEQMLGVVVIEGAFLPEQQRNYLELALLLMPILRLALHNARNYERLYNTKRELRACRMELEQRVEERTRELRASEERLKEAQRIARLGSWELDIVKNELVCSDEAFRLFEIDRNKFPASYEWFLNATHPEDRNAVILAYTRSLETREPYEITHRLLMSDGSIKWVTERCASYFDAEGNPIRTVGTVQDVTDRKRVEEELELSAQLLNSTSDTIFLLDHDGNFVYLNEAAWKSRGYTREEMMGMSLRELNAPEFNKLLAPRINAVMESGHGFFESAHRCKDGRVMPVEINVRVIESGGRKLMLSVIRDITERKLAQEKLLKSEASLRAILDNMPYLAWLKDTTGHYMAANERFLEMLGQKRVQGVLGKTDLDLWPKALAEKYRADDAEVMALRQQKYIEEPALDGNRAIWVETFKTPVIDESGNVLGTTGFARDITERREFEEELRRSNIELEQFGYAISHDMRQPLRMISSYLQLIEMSLGGQLDDEQRDYFGFAIEGAKRIDQMLVELLEYSRVGKGGEPPVLIESRTLLDEALQFLQPAIAEVQARVTLIGEWPQIRVSRDEILRLIQNMIGNAVKFRIAGRAPEITVSSEVVKNEWRLCVSDNGVGIAPGQIRRLFQIFQRLQSRSAYEGNGIGLALCRKIVEHHKGRIWAASAGEGRGSKFCVVLPVLRGGI